MCEGNSPVLGATANFCFGPYSESDADFGVAKADDGAGNNVLQDQVGHGEELPGRGFRPVFIADECFLLTIPTDLHIKKNVLT